MKKLLVFGCIALAATFTSCNSSDDEKTEEVKTNLRVVVAVLDKDGNTLNVQSADANKTKDYVTAGSGFQHRVLIEDFTGAWCGWCPRVSHSIEELEKSDNDKIVAVALHNNDKFAFSPYEGNLSNNLWTKLGFASNERGYPFAVINRNTEWNATSGNLMNLNQVKSLAKESSDIGIKISSELGDTSGKVNVSLKFNADYSDLKYVVYVLENNLILAQENYTTNYGGKGKKAEFVHNSVAKAVNNINGEAVSLSTKGSEFKAPELSVTYKKFAK